ncbi:MAG TPA: glycosyltransferase 87 family protein, partial [Candidatus Baltobacteraceae bacterium]|nr:glycosyltransferase 87 family protein [Candidatus Baltobacteraceae bacterium]
MFRIVSAAVVAAALWFALLTAGMTRNFDFRAFYCGGAAILQRADPYRTQPLHACEQRKTDGAYAAFARETVLPAPQPPYVLGVFALFALLPFGIASKLWAALLFCAAAASIVLVRAIARVPLAAAVAALWLSLCVTSIYLGELIPLFVCALAAAAYCLQKQWWTAAGCFAVATMAEPHLGLAVCASMALWAPRSRNALAIGGIALIAVSAAAVSAPVALEYVQNVLPFHALSEIGSDAQFSAAVLAHKAGASDSAAMRAGTVSFLLAAMLGICIAPSLARIYRERAFLALAPAAFSLIGGVFLHVTDLAAAVPFTLLLLHHEPDRRMPA